MRVLESIVIVCMRVLESIVIACMCVLKIVCMRVLESIVIVSPVFPEVVYKSSDSLWLGREGHDPLW